MPDLEAGITRMEGEAFDTSRQALLYPEHGVPPVDQRRLAQARQQAGASTGDLASKAIQDASMGGDQMDPGQGGGGRDPFNDPKFSRELGSNDMFPAGSQWRNQQSAGVGRYGADMIPVPNTGLVPLAITASRLKAVQDEQAANKAKLDKWKVDLSKVDRAWANEIFEKSAWDDLNSVIDGAVAFHGGDEAKAYSELMDPTSKAYRAFNDRVRSWNNVAGKVNNNLADALAIVNGVEDGSMYVDDKTKELANNYYNGLNGFRGNIHELSDVTDAWEHRLAMVKYVQDKGVVDRLRKAGGVAADGPNVERDPKSGKFLITTDHIKTFEEAKKAEVAMMKKHYAGMQGVTEKDIEYLIDFYTAAEVKRDVIVASPNKPAGGGNKGGGKDDAKWHGALEQRRTMPDPRNPDRQVMADTFLMSDIVGGRSVTPGARAFKPALGSADTEDVMMHPIGVYEYGGERWIYGKQSAFPREQRTKPAGAGGPGKNFNEQIQEALGQGGEGEAAAEGTGQMDFDRLPVKVVPYERNKAQFELYFPGSMEKIDQMLPLKARPSAKAGAKPAASKEDYSQLAVQAGYDWDQATFDQLNQEQQKALLDVLRKKAAK